VPTEGGEGRGHIVAPPAQLVVIIIIICYVCRSAHFHLRGVRHIRAALTDDMAKTVAVSLIHSRIDYANSLIHGSVNVRRLQCVQNSAARVVLIRTAHTSQLLLFRLNCTGCLFSPKSHLR